MKEKGLGLKGTLQFPVKKTLTTAEPLDIEKAVQHLHSGRGKVIRLSLDVSEAMYSDLKIRQVRKGFKKTRDYLLDLIEKDLLTDMKD